jgi:molecular chaperone GrpE (heat shock protein)
MMTNQTVPKLAKWPFVAGDIALLVTAAAIVQLSHRSLDLWQDAIMAGCVALGAWMAIIPFLVEHRAATRAGENSELADSIRQIQKIEAVAADIAAATSKWQGVHEQSAKVAQTARETADRMRGETLEFRAAMAQANDGEKARLKLEIDKLHRAEGEWLQVVVRLLDNTFVLFQAAVRSNQPGLIEQIGQFQNVSRDAARRVGLTPFVPRIGDLFDANTHEPASGQAAAAEGLKVAEVMATGYTYQGQLIRRSLVGLAQPAPPNPARTEPASAPYIPPPTPVNFASGTPVVASVAGSVEDVEPQPNIGTAAEVGTVEVDAEADADATEAESDQEMAGLEEAEGTETIAPLTGEPTSEAVVGELTSLIGTENVAPAEGIAAEVHVDTRAETEAEAELHDPSGESEAGESREISEGSQAVETVGVGSESDEVVASREHGDAGVDETAQIDAASEVVRDGESPEEAAAAVVAEESTMLAEGGHVVPAEETATEESAVVWHEQGETEAQTEPAPPKNGPRNRQGRARPPRDDEGPTQALLL